MSRYIDADKIPFFGYEKWKAITTKSQIDRQPTADVRENVRGEWQRILFNGDTDYVKCSHCGMDFEYVDGVCYLVAKNELPNFCPNCGAEMS